MSQHAPQSPAPASWPAPYPAYGYPPPHPAPPADPLPAPATPYHQFLRTGRNRWWKGLVVIVLLVVGYFLVAGTLIIVAFVFEAATGRITWEQLERGDLVITPLVLLATNLGLAALIPISMLLQWGFYGQPVRWLHSVRGYLRWDLLKRMALIIVPIFALYVLATAFLDSAPSRPLTAESFGLLAVVLLTTPLQAAGEEYATRGLVARAAGSWVASPLVSLVVSTVASATLFTLAHGAADPWLIFYYFLFGVAMSIVVWRTGGLEVAVLIHTANNLLLFIVAILAGQDLAASLERGEGSGGPWMLIPMVLLAGITALVWWRARQTQVVRTYSGAGHALP